jgi:transcriptional regulator with XRE-family HTH domain
MGRATREKPARLAEKLLQIRLALKLSQGGILDRLGISNAGYRNYISDFENGVREPSLPVLLKYARVANIWVDVLIDDSLDLPKQLPSSERSGGAER